MPRIPGTTNAQTLFLRAFRHHPAGPPPEDWPSPVVLRRWLARPAFLNALATLREVLHLRTEFHLAAAANQAAQELQSPPTPDAGLTPQDYKRRLDLLRLTQVHRRSGFDDAESDPAPPHAGLGALATTRMPPLVTLDTRPTA
jgi:hypothetical protein